MGVTTFADLSRILIEHYKTSNLRSLRSTTFRLKRLDTFFANYRARDITADRVTAYVAERLEEKAANATINRELAALKRAFKLAHEAKRVASVPVIRLLPEDNARQGFIEHADFIALRDALPERLRDCVTFLYLSGWRVGEMKALEWRDLDRDGRAVRLPPAKSKNRKGRVLPLSGELRNVIDRARKQRRLDCPFIFHRHGRAIKDFRTAWNTACHAVGLGKLLVHDLRRTVVRNLVRAGISDKVAMDLTGHKTRSVLTATTSRLSAIF
ncbi:MAG TPA: site-specific integrase [Candidatus Binataceae bacterium]